MLCSKYPWVVKLYILICHYVILMKKYPSFRTFFVFNSIILGKRTAFKTLKRQKKGLREKALNAKNKKQNKRKDQLAVSSKSQVVSSPSVTFTSWFSSGFMSVATHATG